MPKNKNMATNFETPLLKEEKDLVLNYMNKMIKDNDNHQVHVSDVLNKFVKNPNEAENVLTKSKVFEAVKQLREEGKINPVAENKIWAFGKPEVLTERIARLQKMAADYK